MARHERILAIDPGSTRFRAILAEPDGRGDVAILVTASCEAAGLDRSELADIGAASEAIASLLEIIREGSTEDLPDRAMVALPGDHVRTLSAQGVLNLSAAGVAVGPEHLAEVRRKVQAIELPFDQSLLHVEDVDFTLDGRSGLSQPLGMVGTRLQLEAHIVAGEQAAIATADQMLSRAGSPRPVLVFPAIATGLYASEPRDRELGCLVVDIGGELTHYALYYRGRLRRSGVVPVGGNHVSRDLAYGLGCDLVEAERIKRGCGSALRSAAAHAGRCPGVSEAELPRIAAICEARQMEILELVAQGLQWGITRPALAAGIVLTGGGSRLQGTAELAEQVFSLRAEARRAPGDDYGEVPDSWATALGLIRYALEEKQQTPAMPQAGMQHTGLIQSVKHWIGRLV